MLKTSKKVISLILVVFMLFSAFPLQGFAGEVEFDTLVQTQEQFDSNARVAGKNYCATAAAQWAIDHWNDYNSVLYNKGYWDDGGDCANFVSQCLYMGGMDMDGYWNISGYFCHWSENYGNTYAGSYVRCQQLYNYLVKVGAQVIQNPSASQVSIGDVILYKRQGASRMTHSAIVIDIQNGVPVVAAHSTGTTRYRSDWSGYDWHLNFSGNNTYLMKLNGTTCVNYNPRNFDVYVAKGGDTRLYNSASTSSGYTSTFLTGSYPDYAHVYKKSEDGQWGYTFRYGNWGWIRLKNFTYLSHQQSAPVSHDFGAWFVVQVANCQQDGLDKRICKRCGYEESKVTKGGHVIDPHATCLSEGFCKICGAVCEKPLGHDWDNGTVTTQPTCTEEGVKTFVCKRDSSHVKTAPVPALGHDYKTSVTSPTCTAHGETLYTCTRCSDSYMVSDPNGSWSDWTEDTSLLSTLPSSKVQTKTQYSYRDKKYNTSSSSTMSGWTHYDTKRTSWGSTQGPVYSDPSNGVRNTWSEQYISGYNQKTVYVYYKYGASELDYSYTYQTSSKPNYYEVELDYSPSSTSQRPVAKSGNQYQWYYGGGTSWAAVYFKETRTKDNLNSPIYSTRWYYQEPVYTYYFWQWGSWSSWSDTAVSSTSEREVKTRTLYKYDLTALGHDWKNDTKVQVCACGTGERDDKCYAIGQICDRCGIANDSSTITYYDHAWGPEQEYTINGKVERRAYCKNCKCFKAGSCVYLIVDTIAPTCTTDGYDILVCKYHGEEKKDNFVKALGHNVPADAEGVVIEPATCTKDGVLRKYCERYDDGKTCSHYVDSPIPAFGHTMIKHDAVSATCTEDGNSVYYNCDLCNKFFADENGKTEVKKDSWIISAYGHVDESSVEWVIVSENGCGKTGWKHKLCDREVDGKVCGCVLKEEAIPEIPADYYIAYYENCELVDGEYVPTRCDADAIVYWTCRNCEGTDHAHSSQPDVVYEPEHMGRLPHIEAVRIIKEAYCIYPGEFETYCSRCNSILEEGIIPAPCSEHKLVEIKAEGGCVYKKCTNAPCEYIEGGDHNFQRDTLRDIAPNCVRTGLEAWTCTKCGETKDVVLEALGHDHAFDSKVEPKCADAGYSVYRCQRINNGEQCTDTYNIDFVPPIGHDLKKTDAIAPLCEKDGISDYYTCQRDYCQKIFSNAEATIEITLEDAVVPQLGHEPDNNWVVTKEPTCSEKGEEQCKCVRHDDGKTCEKIFTREIEINPDGHDWDEGVIETSPTCKEYGSMIFTCKNDDSHKNVKLVVPLDPYNHVGETYVKDAKEPTCTVDGYTGDTYCSDCNAMLEEGKVIPAHGHDWDEWTTVTAPTCEEDGLERRICKIDSTHIEENILKAIGHDWDDGVIDPSATCKDHGTKTYTCQNDNSHKKTEEVTLDATNHVGETYVKDVKEATCTEDGYTGNTYCADCNEKLTDGEVIPAYGHDWDEWTVETEATCEGKGLEKRVCKNDANHIEENELEPIGHKWDDGVIDPSSSCKENGTKTYTCQNDNSHTYTEKVELNPDGHYGETYIKDAKEATCTEDGYTGDTYCSDCNEKLKDGEVIPAHGHDWDEWETTKKPTCDVDGEKERVCKYDDSHTEKGDVPATGHNIVVDVAKEPTCTEEGITAGSHCESCGETIEAQETIPALGHDMGDWYIKTPADYGVAGVEQRDCSRCDYNETKPIAPLVKNTYVATFVIGDSVVGTVTFEEGDKYINEPEMPKKDNYVGYWEDYELKNENITINGYYDPINPDDISDIIPEKKAEYNDGIVEITLSAKANTKQVNVISENTTPVDVILVLDQSGSMTEKLGSQTKIDSLATCANNFVDKIYENAVATGADHRVAVVGFAMGNYTSDSRNYPEYMNTAVLTTGGNPVGFMNADSDVYSNALMSIVGSDGKVNPNVKNVLDRKKFNPKGATAANLGLEMASLIIDNNPLEVGEKRQRIVLFITDGIPTLYVDTNKDQVLPVANNAIKIAKDLKESALVYSIGIADGIDTTKNFTSASDGWSNNSFDFNRFLHYVSSNYIDAESMSNGGEGSKDNGFYLAVQDTNKLNSIFDGILYSSVYTIESFDKVTLVDTISSDFTLTMEQEEELRNKLAAEQGIGRESVTITRNQDGTTKIVIENVKAKKVYDASGKAYYKAEVTFNVTANENALESGEYETNTDDAGIMIDGAYVGKFEVPTITIEDRRNIVVFTINGVVYRIDEGKLGEVITVPESSLAEWNIPEGTVIEGSYTEFEATEINKDRYTITWVVGDEVIETKHTVGSVFEPVDVDVPNGMEFAGWSPALRQTMPAANLTYTAKFRTAHEHNWVHIAHSGDCENGITVIYECECGETKTEERPCTDHSYTAVVVPNDTKTINNIICTNEYCSKSQGNQISYRCSYSLKMGWRTQIIEVDLYEKGIQVQPENGDIAIMIPLDSEIANYNFTVTRIDEDNNEVQVKSEKKDGYLIFYTDHFSIFKITLLDENGNPSEDLSYSQCICELDGHGFSDETVEPTCTTEGYTKHTCSNCGYFYFDNNVEATGHDYKEETVESSCTQNGYTKYVCNNCGHTYTEGETESSGHNYETVITAPTCTTDGYTTYVCTVCNFSYVADEVKSSGHNYNETVVAPTCTTAGYTTFVCVVCDDSYVGNNVAATGHNIVDRVVESDCTNGGYTVHECTECDYSYVDSTTSEGGHNYVQTVVPATCTATGYTNNVCSVCGHSYVSDETTLAAHTPSDWTLSAEGKYVKICTVCNAVVETRVSDIAINGTVNGSSSMTVYYKMSKPLDVTASAGKIIYTSADPSIATVDENGRVTGVKKGTTTITATIEGTNDSVTCEVTVKYTWWQQIIRIALLGFLWY